MGNRNNNSVLAAKTASGLNFLFGLWLILAPFVLGYQTSAARANDIIVGIAIAIMGGIRFFSIRREVWLSWINAVLGFWLFVAPFALSYVSSSARANDIIVGLIILALGVWSALATRSRPYI